GTEFGAAMDHHHACGDLGERDRPIDRRIAAAGDDDALIAERLAPGDQVEDALALILLDPVERRAVRAESADAGGDDHGFGEEGNAAAGLDSETAVRLARESFDLLAEVIDGCERR